MMKERSQRFKTRNYVRRELYNTFSDFFSSQIGATLCSSGYHIGESDAKMHKFKVIIGRHRFRNKAG